MKEYFAQGQRTTIKRVRERQQMEQLRKWKEKAVERDEMEEKERENTMTIRRTGIWREAVTETGVVMRQLQPVNDKRAEPTRETDLTMNKNKRGSEATPAAKHTTNVRVKPQKMTEEHARASAARAVTMLREVQRKATQSRSARVAQLDFLDQLLQSLATRVARLLEATRK